MPKKPVLNPKMFPISVAYLLKNIGVSCEFIGGTQKTLRLLVECRKSRKTGLPLLTNPVTV